MFPFRHLNYRFRIVGLILLGCLLVIVAALQYHWLNEISQAQVEQTRRQLDTAINQLACQFDAEIMRATMAFHPVPERSPDRRQALTDAWREWQQEASHPELVRSAILLDSSSGAWKPVSMASAAGEANVEVPPFHPPVPETAGPEGMRILIPGLMTVGGNPVVMEPALAVPPPFDGGPVRIEPQISWLLLTFDRGYLLHDLLPNLTQKNLGPLAQTEYALRIRSDGQDQIISARGDLLTGTEWRKADASVSLFGNRLDCSSATPFPPAGRITTAFGMAGIVRASPLHLQGRRTAVMSGRGGVGLSTGVAGSVSPDSSSWTLLVRHRSGSLDEALAEFRRRNLLVSAGVLLILATSIAVLTLSAERASILAKAQTEMAIGLSHELKTPLTALRIAAGNLKSGKVTTAEQVSRYGDVIDAQSGRLLALVENTLRYARAQPAVSDPLRVAVTPKEIVQAALKNREEELNQAGMRVELAVEDLDPICVDGALLTHCFENLIDNAVKYAARGEYLGIRAESFDNGRPRLVRFTVEDRGSGIERQDLPYIFEPFYRGVSARSSRTEGIGVGLAFVKRVIQAHHGRIEARSTPHGATFILEIPAMTSEEKS